MRRGGFVLLVCDHAPCSEIFARRKSDFDRLPRVFCSRRCFALAISKGRTTLSASCSHCGGRFQREAHSLRRSKTHYCSPACAKAGTDFGALGRLGSRVPRFLPAEVLRRRASLGGIARAQRLSADRLSEIGRMGVEARERTAGARLRASVNRRAGRVVVLGVRLGRRA